MDGCSFIVTRMLLCLAATVLASQPALTDEDRGFYRFDGWSGPALRVFYTRPPGLHPSRPMVMVMHGQSRTAEKYRDDWHDLAIEYDFLLIVPEFTKTDFSGSRSYNLGNRVDDEGQLNPREEWSFSAPMALFEDAKKRFDVTATQFALYGHSAGSQFVHRFLMHMPEAPVSRVVAANAGWYSMPDFDIDYPYGLHGSQIKETALKGFLAMSVTILLGDADTLTDQSNLRQSPEAKPRVRIVMRGGMPFSSKVRKQHNV
ncbi:MAG: alpha/beta hydrolase [Gammaproteobacteria bacterium]|nr:alpha/beta hydrolase [Gammaproteobacteria bacterium]